MKTPGIDKQTAKWENDPKVKRTLRKFRAGMLLTQATWETIFPPESPTSRRRGGCKLAPTEDLKNAVWAILDARIGHPVDPLPYTAAMRAGDGKFFQLMNDACAYLDAMPQAQSRFANHVIAARRVAGNAIPEDGPLPAWRTIKGKVAALLGQAAYDETSKDWGRVRKVAGLLDLPD